MDVLGWVGSAVLVVSLTQTRVLRFRALNLLAAFLLVIFNAAIGVWPMAALNVVVAAINIWVLVRLTRRRHDDRAYQVVPIGTREAYLDALLTRHAPDIARFNPSLSGQPQAGSDFAFLTLSEGETIGVVLARRTERPGEARVLLDYVLPRFRDFTPGEFVFRPGGPFATLGISRVLAPTDMRESSAYLRAVGFRPGPEGLALDLASPSAGRPA